MADPGVLSFNPDDLTIGDMEDFEDHAGMTVDDALRERVVIDPSTGKPFLDDKGRPVREVQMSAKVLKVFVWIIKRHDDPEFKLEDARNVKIREIQFADDSTAADDPKGSNE